MIFQTYLVREFVRYTFLIIVFFSLLYSFLDFLEKNARYFPKHNTPGSVILEYYLLQMPKMVVELLPFAVLFGGIITLWLFARSGEIAAVRAAGASIGAICAPLFVAGGLLAFASFAVAEFALPKVQTRLRYVETVKIERSRLSRMFLDSHWIRSGEVVLHFESYDRIRGILRNTTLYTFADASSLSSVARSSRAYFDPRSESWVLQNAIQTVFPSGVGLSSGMSSNVKMGVPLGNESWSTKELRLRYLPTLDTRLTAEPPRILSANVGTADLGFVELLQLMRESEQAGISAHKRLIDLYQKLSLPLANVLFIFLAVPFCIRHERQADTYAGVFVALGLALVFWAGNFALRSLAQSGLVPPLVAAFSMSLLLLAFGSWQLRQLNSRI
jgi:lipopolysaccharide export system permease protein